MVFVNGTENHTVTEKSPLLPQADPQQKLAYPLSSKKKTFGNIVISVVGAGVLGLPYTFMRTGWLTGSLVLVIIGYACYYCMMLLVSTRKKLDTEGRVGRAVVDFTVVLSQGGFCVGYLIFIGENLASILSSFDSQSPKKSPGVAYTGLGLDQLVTSNHNSSFLGLDWGSKGTYVWLLFPLQVGLAAIRSLTHLAPFSIFADVANALAMAVVMKDDIVQIEGGLRHVTASTGASSIPFAIGVAIYAFEGIPLVLPLESVMKEKTKFGRVMGFAMSWIAALYITFGLLGYLAFGNETEDIVTLNLGESWETLVIQLGLCVGLFFTYPVMMHPVHEVIERSNSARFADFMSLVGSSACSILVFILPALFHLRVRKDELSPYAKGLDYFLITFGVTFGIWGTISALLNIF
ncbi:hypothetical protein O6H91_Y382300 [Diphasiastrum complanatum]|nr:hypothetical protein O6H91_Y382300 [Diphasiastrum complanatum]